MLKAKMITLDGNEAAARISHRINEVIAIYPITPASPMGELADQYSSLGQKNIWGQVPQIIEMQSEGGAAGTVHGALQAGALTTTFTASQGLLLMIPNMYKIAGELTAGVIHVAARSLAAQALSIFGDHSDVMATRGTGYAMLASASVQEVLDMSLISQAVSLEGRIPLLHFFDGFRTSHELSKIVDIDESVIREIINDDWVTAHRARALSPDHPVVRGTSQNPDVYFQARETVNTYYRAFPEIVQTSMDKFAELTGRSYKLFEYYGHPDAEEVCILMGSAVETAEETVDHLLSCHLNLGLLRVRLYRPFSVKHLVEALPASVRKIAVLDRCKEPGSAGEPLYKDVMTALAEYIAEGGDRFVAMPRVIGGRYGLSSKEFTPGMVTAVFDNLAADNPKNHFTIGIHDDVTHTSLEWDKTQRNLAMQGVSQCLFYGLGSDGTVSANKNTIKIIAGSTDQYAQGYFVYDSKKAGAVTVSHLRFSNKQINSPYLINDGEADFIGCHQPVFLERYPMLEKAAEGAVFLLNITVPADEVWRLLPVSAQQAMLAKNIRFYVIDAYQVAQESGMGRRINTVMQTCFFAISGVLPPDEAINEIKQAVQKAYGKKGKKIVERNYAAIDATLAGLHEVELPSVVNSNVLIGHPVPDFAPEFVRQVTGEIIAGRGDELPVSLLPDDGTYPTGTSAWEKRGIALEIPVWNEDLCIFCGKCPFVCPHSAIRSKVFMPEEVADAPAGFKHLPIKGKEFSGEHISYQVAPEDCTGCGLCVEVCPAYDKSNRSRKALMMEPMLPLRDQERENWQYFLEIPEHDRKVIRWTTLKGSMLSQPLFEFSGACLGCGETPYIRLATQLFGDRMLIANATGCSSIYGGNLPTTPYTVNPEGRGPAWSNSLFEDNAEFGLGFQLAVEQQRSQAVDYLTRLEPVLGDSLVGTLLAAPQTDETEIQAQRERVAEVREKLKDKTDTESRQLLSVIDYMVNKSVWIIGGDGWAYDIGFGGLDHVLASGKNVNILVLDTEVYSNTGGQTSKATPKGAVAKFSAGGKASSKKDLGMIAMSYENVYVASVASGGKDVQTLKAFREAESYPGTSIIIAYSPCIAHGVDLSKNLDQQKLAVNSGHWPLYRYDPRLLDKGKNPLQLDSKKPSIKLREYYQTETRFSMLWQSHPDTAETLLSQEQKNVLDKYHHLEQLASLAVTEENASEETS